MKKKLIRFFMRLLAAMPLGVHRFNAHIVGWIARVLVRYRRKVVQDNIDKAFPELGGKERKKIFRDFYLHFGQLVCETIWFGGSKKERLVKSGIVNIVNPEELRRLHESVPGTVVLCAHMGNWEIYGGAPYYDSGHTLTKDNCGVVYRRLRNAMWNDIFKENRLYCLEGVFEHYIESSNIIRHMYGNADKKMFYFIITDQWPYFKAPSYIEVNFMGRRTRTMSGAAQVARRYSLAVSYLSMRRREKGKGYDMEFVPICDNAATMDLQSIMDKYYSLLEQDIRKDPGNYLWSHRRWKKY